MLVLTSILFGVALTMCSVAFWILKTSDTVNFDFSTDDLPAELWRMTHKLVGWIVIGLMLQGVCLFLLAIVLPIVDSFS